MGLETSWTAWGFLAARKGTWAPFMASSGGILGLSTKIWTQVRRQPNSHVPDAPSTLPSYPEFDSFGGGGYEVLGAVGEL